MLSITVALCAALVATGASPAAPVSLPPVQYFPPKLDAAKADLARSVAARLLPTGSTAEWARQSPGLSGLVHQYLMLPVTRFVEERGAKLPEEGVDGPPVVRVRLLSIIDPASVERVSVIGPVVEKIVAEIATSREPELRKAMALAYGQRLSVGELQALDRFLATPEGSAFARSNRVIWEDWGVYAAQQFMFREIEAAEPVMKRRIAKATALMPKIKEWADLTEPERREVAKLLKIEP